MRRTPITIGFLALALLAAGGAIAKPGGPPSQAQADDPPSERSAHASEQTEARGSQAPQSSGPPDRARDENAASTSQGSAGSSDEPSDQQPQPSEDTSPSTTTTQTEDTEARTEPVTEDETEPTGDDSTDPAPEATDDVQGSEDPVDEDAEQAEPPSEPAESSGAETTSGLAAAGVRVPFLDGATTTGFSSNERAPGSSLAANGGAVASSGGADDGQASASTDVGQTWMLPSLLFGVLGAGTVLMRRERDYAAAQKQPSGEQAAGADAGVPSPPEGPLGLLERGQEALDEGAIETAAGWFETAIAVEPDLQAAHVCLGVCLDEMGRLEEAEKRLAHARQLEENDLLAIYAHASVLARTGRQAEALLLLERLADRAPTMLDAMRDDEELDVLDDHPRFLALIGEL